MYVLLSAVDICVYSYPLFHEKKVVNGQCFNCFINNIYCNVIPQRPAKADLGCMEIAFIQQG